ncbi:WD domain, G-beta repeat containing protein [Coccidioides posadasii C735 delta SOWgp]|uniref:Probable cytosolic iron-sulfur protein assembly protein 1 n=1 Tax=Coccidioides posadasii (strain C735) TaxID=222929 RepID=C5P636_COCP7|nr:WD domain, G-beta repeat containing protein [Coccidioides posadasii C735 delta SOWgp]EER28176.1 WD domain, G-beta repeat containing protein [Coccidioides posadasii C735 delta SOWgp]|eukprot:XP_003070321.1 WD domain, G-beta repeat containing protein [Coccidioides posadasii C735 delta SOWgp]
MPSSTPEGSLKHLSDLTPPSQDRTWLTSPHPRLPIAATCCADKSVRVYSLVNFTLLSTISGGHKRSVRSCAWKPHVKGESVLATASFDATVGVWRRWDGFGRAERDMLGLAGGLAEADRQEGDDTDGDEEDEDEEWGFAVLLDGHDSEVKSVSWSSGGSLLATCSRDKSIWIWEDLEDGDNNFETVAVLQEHSGDVKWVAWHPEEECLASGSYDDTIRLWREDVDDWGQVACLRGHEGTVWCVEWEAPTSIAGDNGDGAPTTMPIDPENGKLAPCERKKWIEERSMSGPRLVSCSDDKTIRIWRKQPQEKPPPVQYSSIPSTIRPATIDETWIEECQLPAMHDLSIYSVAWSKKTGLIASTGADGRIVIYQERFTSKPPAHTTSEQDKPDSARETQKANGGRTAPSTAWEVVACVDAAHEIYEVNHVCWAKRADQRKSQQQNLDNSEMDHANEEEVLLSTGDDGVVRAWTLER